MCIQKEFMKKDLSELRSEIDRLEANYFGMGNIKEEEYYTARHELLLNPGEQYCIEPNMEHRFQAGDKGSVTLEFKNTVDQTKNILYDPGKVF